MPRPKTKEALIDLSNKNFNKLLTYVDSFTDEEKNKDFPPGTLNRNIRDVLAHIHHWHLMLLEWYRVGQTGKKPAMPADGYTWKDLPELNTQIREKYITETLPQCIKYLRISFDSIQGIIQKHTEKDLFEKKKYIWTGSTSLAAYLISATSSHYDWGYKLIKKAKKK